MNENQHLLPILTDLFQNLRIAYVIHGLDLFDGFLIGYAYEFLLQRTRAERSIKVEQTGVWIDSEEGCDVSIVGQCSTETHQADRVTSLFGSSDRSADNAFKDWTAVIVK